MRRDIAGTRGEAAQNGQRREGARRGAAQRIVHRFGSGRAPTTGKLGTEMAGDSDREERGENANSPSRGRRGRKGSGRHPATRIEPDTAKEVPDIMAADERKREGGRGD